MTAVNCIRTRDRIFVITDGAHYDAKGVVQHIGSKVLELPSLRAVIACRGSQLLVAKLYLSVMASFVLSFEDLLRGLPEMLREACIGEQHNVVEVVVAGISFERGRPESYYMFGHPNTIPDANGERIQVAAFTLAEAPPIVGAPDAHPELLAEYGAPSQLDPEHFDPWVHGMAVMQAQRRTLGTMGVPVVGGFALLNTITAFGINSQIMFQWPDRIGRCITPPGLLPAPSLAAEGAPHGRVS